MTGADLCASTKPWDVQVSTVKVIFEEFYAQVYETIRYCTLFTAQYLLYNTILLQ